MEHGELLKRIESLCNERGITPNTAFIESGVGKNFKSNLKYANPSLGKITMLANYFDVSVDYLLGKTSKKEKSPSITDEDIRIALFGGDGDVSDEAWEEVKRFAAYAKEKYGKK